MDPGNRLLDMGPGMKEWQIVWSALEKSAISSQSGPMAAYMKNRFPFLGIQTPARKALLSSLKLEIADFETLRNLVKLCFEAAPREAHYAGLDLLERHHRLWTGEVLNLLETLTTTKSWWDTADRLSSPLMWRALRRFPEENGRPDAWIASSDLWLQRAALLYQRTAKAETDTQRLTRYIEATQDSPEFFLRKAIGWALRQYGYTNPEWVRRFVAEHPNLSALSRREALRALPAT